MLRYPLVVERHAKVRTIALILILTVRNSPAQTNAFEQDVFIGPGQQQ